MSFEGFPGREVRAKLDHPVIDADAHVVECDFAHLDFVRQIARRGDGQGGARRCATIADRPCAASGGACRRARTPATARWRSCRAISARAWTSRHRLRALLHDARPQPHLHRRTRTLRRASCRALNMLYAEMFARRAGPPAAGGGDPDLHARRRRSRSSSSPSRSSATRRS